MIADLQKLTHIKPLQIMTLLMALSLVALVAVRWTSYQWDFSMFYGSATDFLRGTSPYRGTGLSFYHPPLTLHFYGLFARLPYALAYELWLALKIAALGALFLIWSRHFLRLDLAWTTVLYFILAYNGAIYSDLASGNISLFEQLGLWFGFAALLQGRYALFSLCIILAAQFKLTPILFAVLLLFVPSRPQWQWVGICVGGFLAVFLLNVLLHPALLQDFLTVAPTLKEPGPDTITLVRDVFDRIGGPRFSDGTRADEAIFVIAAFTIGIFSLAAIIRYRRANADADSKLIIYLVCLAYALAAPRLRAYSYILLLIPTLALIRLLPWRTLVPLASAALATMVVFPVDDSLLPFRSLSHLLYENMAQVAVFAAWVGLLHLMTRDDIANTEGTLPADRGQA